MEIHHMTRDQLDGMKCSAPGCDHTAHGGSAMYLHQTCHTGRGLVVEDYGLNISLRCAVCGRGVAQIDKIGFYAANRACGHEFSPVFASYLDGVLTFSCKVCDQEFGQLVVI